MRCLIVAILVALCALARPARADAPAETVALLPLATGKGFELYGQPVASEVARALRAGGLEVVVVSAVTAVPPRARLVVDGTISGAGKGAVALQVRIRDPEKGVVIATLDSTAPSLSALDHAAADLAARLLPAVKEQLARRAPPLEAHAPSPPHPPPSPPSLPPAPPAALAWSASHATDFPAGAAADVARALVARTQHRAIDASHAPDGKPLTDGPFEIAVEIQRYELVQDGVWTARATARVRWIGGDGTPRADRVVHTDTLVGSRTDDAAAMARHVSAQLVDIIAPHLDAWWRSAP